MFEKRKIKSSLGWLDADNIKICTVTIGTTAVDHAAFKQWLEDVNKSRNLD